MCQITSKRLVLRTVSDLVDLNCQHFPWASVIKMPFRLHAHTTQNKTKIVLDSIDLPSSVNLKTTARRNLTAVPEFKTCTHSINAKLSNGYKFYTPAAPHNSKRMTLIRGPCGITKIHVDFCLEGRRIVFCVAFALTQSFIHWVQLVEIFLGQERCDFRGRTNTLQNWNWRLDANMKIHKSILRKISQFINYLSLADNVTDLIDMRWHNKTKPQHCAIGTLERTRKNT